jgi:hypothetical protein
MKKKHERITYERNNLLNVDNDDRLILEIKLSSSLPRNENSPITDEHDTQENHHDDNDDPRNHTNDTTNI